MRKSRFLVILPLILALFLSACRAGNLAGETDGASEAGSVEEAAGDIAEETEESFAAVLPDEAYEAVEYNLYPYP